LSRITQPLASLRLATAIRYWHAARLVMSQQSAKAQFMEPVGYLISMAAELGLKAFLQQKGMPDAKIASKPLGHNLDALLHHAIERGLEVSADEAQVIILLNIAHTEHFYRYGPLNFEPQLHAIQLCEEEAALVMVAKLLDHISEDPALLRVQHAKPHPIADWPETFPVLFPMTLPQLREMQADIAQRAKAVASNGAPHRRT
jgi:hypothetical protein